MSGNWRRERDAVAGRREKSGRRKGGKVLRGKRNEGFDKDGMGILPGVLVECERMMDFKRQSSQKTVKCTYFPPTAAMPSVKLLSAWRWEKKVEEDLVHLGHASSAVEL